MNVVLPEPVDPATRIFFRCAMAARITYSMGALPDGEYRLPHHRWDHAFEAASIRGQFCFNNGVVVIDDRVANCRDRAERAQSLRGKHRAHDLKIFMRPLHPHSSIGIQQNIFGKVIFKTGSDQWPEFPNQLFVTAFGDLMKFLHSLLPMRDKSA